MMSDDYKKGFADGYSAAEKNLIGKVDKHITPKDETYTTCGKCGCVFDSNLAISMVCSSINCPIFYNIS